MALIDLTHVIDPKNVQRKFKIETVGADTINERVVRLENQWYIMTNITMVSHIATHIEVPYHLFPDGHDLATMPIESFSGKTILLDLSNIQKHVKITKENVIDAAVESGGILPGDIVLCNLGYADYYGTDKYKESPYFATDAIEWLVDSGMKMMGVDAGGVEIPGSEDHVNHAVLFKNNIPLIENVANLNNLPVKRFWVYAFPISVAGVESFPVRVVAEV